MGGDMVSFLATFKGSECSRFSLTRPCVLFSCQFSYPHMCNSYEPMIHAFHSRRTLSVRILIHDQNKHELHRHRHRRTIRKDKLTILCVQRRMRLLSYHTWNLSHMPWHHSAARVMAIEISAPTLRQNNRGL